MSVGEEIWSVLKPVVVIFLFLGAAVVADMTFGHSAKDLVQWFLREAKEFTRGRRTEPAMNMLFGIILFLGVLLLIAAIAVSTLFSTVRERHHVLDVPGDVLIFCSLFLLFIFFIFSVAYCKRVDRR